MDSSSYESYADHMAETPKSVRIDSADWTALKAAAPRNNRNQLIKDLIRWYLNHPDAELPIRPAPKPN